MIRLIIFTIGLLWNQNLIAQAEPALPPGLFGGGSEGSKDETTDPDLDDSYDEEEDDDDFEDESSFINGFLESRQGVFLDDDSKLGDRSLNEWRVRIEAEPSYKSLYFKFAMDFVLDNLEEDHHKVDLEEGSGWLDLRQASLRTTPFSFLDVKIGRQTLTWGTGDLVFINDLFPKDYKSFLLGRHTEYLKAPSDAVNLSSFSNLGNIDFVWIPIFDADRYIDGRRLTLFNQAKQDFSGKEDALKVDRNKKYSDNSEYHLRVSKNFNGNELALYAYRGFWKSPSEWDSSGVLKFSKLQVMGASLRLPILGGIFNAEYGLYDSLDDQDGDNPLIRNSEQRYLLGFDFEPIQSLSLAAQYYAEQLLSFEKLKSSLPGGLEPPNEVRDTLTLRLTKFLFSQTMTISLFAFYSPSDEDAYLIPKVSYKLDDNWLIEGGGNLFYAENNTTFWGQFNPNDNVYLAVRRSY